MEPPWTTSSTAIGRRLRHLVGDLDVRPGEQGGDDDHDHAQPDEQDRGVRHLVAAALDRAEHPDHHPLRGLGRGGAGRGRLAHGVASPVCDEAASAKRPRNSASASTAFSNSSSNTRSFGAWMLAKPSVVPKSRISASGTASPRALTSGMEPPVATQTGSLPQAASRAARAARYAGPTWPRSSPSRSPQPRPRAGYRTAASTRGAARARPAPRSGPAQGGCAG